MKRASVLAETVRQDLTEAGSGEDQAAVCGRWLTRLRESLEEVQGHVVEINFVGKEAPLKERRVVPVQLQYILHRCQELLRALQVLAALDPTNNEGAEHATLGVEIDACRHEASRLLESFCVPFGTSDFQEGSMGSVVRGIWGGINCQSCASKRDDREPASQGWCLSRSASGSKPPAVAPCTRGCPGLSTCVNRDPGLNLCVNRDPAEFGDAARASDAEPLPQQRPSPAAAKRPPAVAAPAEPRAASPAEPRADRSGFAAADFAAAVFVGPGGSLDHRNFPCFDPRVSGGGWPHSGP